MKKMITLFLAGFITTFSFAQEEVKLNDSVIFINNKPVALYAKEINNAVKLYNMEVYSFTDYVLIKAELLKFSAPVDELKPFYYYELTFPPTNDTLAIYIKEDLSGAISRLIRDYKLINNDQIDKKGVNQLKAHYPGAPALVAKIKEMKDYLNDSRQFDQQVTRDRTKPVILSKDKKIMQDGVMIGYYMHTTSENLVNGLSVQSKFLQTQTNYNKSIADGAILYLENNFKISSSGSYYPDRLGKTERGYKLYKNSTSKDIVQGSVEDLILIRICCLIEDFRL